MKTFSSLTRDQKEAVGLLQIGTFLEYFDLMLYVHMAVLLNELFFPKTDPQTNALLAAFAFCSTYILRPFGALIFGYIGDNIGRKATIIITTTMMSVSCIIMATLPTYDQIGITAAWLVTTCRIVQGLSSMGEVIGAQIYLTEITKPPFRYFAGDLTSVCSALGGFAALMVASLATISGFDWRNAFWMGACIALVGSVARTRLRETPEFVDVQLKLKRALAKAKEEGLEGAATLLNARKYAGFNKPSRKMQIAYFIICSVWPACFYYSYVHCANILKFDYGLSPQEIIQQNLIVSIIHVMSFIFYIFLSQKVHPFKIIKCRAYVYLIFIILCPYFLAHSNSVMSIFIIQVISIVFALSGVPGNAIFISHFPVFKRFTYTSFMYALSRALMYVITSFSLVLLVEHFSHYGILIIMLPLSLGFLWSISYFEKLEQQSDEISYPQKGKRGVSQPVSHPI